MVVRVTKTWESSAIRQDIILDAGSDRVDVQMEVDWNENQQMLKVSFPIAADAAQASYEMAYGSLERPTTRDTELDARKFEVSGHKWADITDDDGSHGVSILNDSKYGWDALNLEDGTTRLRLSALRSPMGADVRCSGWDPDEYYINSIYGIGYNAGVDAARALPPVERYGGFRLRAAIAARGYSLDLTAAGSDGSGDWKLAMRLSDVFRWDASGTTEVTPSDFPPETAPPAGVPVTDSL